MKIKKYLYAILMISMIVLIVCDCGFSRPATDVPVETIPVTEPEETIPPETEPPAPEGFGVTVDGNTLESGSILLNDVMYVRAEEFFQALDDAIWYGKDETGFFLDWEGRLYQVSPTRETVLVDHQAIALFDPVCTYRDSVWLPLEEVCIMLNISMLDDPEESHVYCTSGILNFQIPSGIRIPVLMYHAVNEVTWGYPELFVTPQVMEDHLIYLLENGYDPIFFEDLPYADQYDKPVILTFDDGYLDNFTTLYPLLQKYQVKATIFVVTSSIGGLETSMSAEQVKWLSDSGLVSIQSHTVNHRVLEGLSAEEQEMEMERSRLYVARLTGREPFVISYPTGAHDQTTLDLAEEYYRFGVIVKNRDYVTGTDPYSICRYNIRDTTTMAELAWMVSDAGNPA